MPPLRPFFQLKPTEDVVLKRETIPLGDIEFVTDRVVKVVLSDV